jgi:RNAse (barnase) inhibitor barstar
MNVFAFTDEHEATEGTILARVPAGIETTDELFDALTELLHLPSYFGRNWDALSDVLRDFHWLAPRRIVIAHAEVPALPERQREIYVSVLRHAVEDWKQRAGDHELVVSFPEATQLELYRLLAR